MVAMIRRNLIRLKSAALGRPLNSSTILEVTVALVIISLVFSMALIIYLRIQKNTTYSLKLAVEMMMEEVFIESRNSGKMTTREISIGNVTVYQEVSPYLQSPDLVMVRLEARTEKGKLLCEKKHLVYVPI